MFEINLQNSEQVELFILIPIDHRISLKLCQLLAWREDVILRYHHLQNQLVIQHIEMLQILRVLANMLSLSLDMDKALYLKWTAGNSALSLLMPCDKAPVLHFTADYLTPEIYSLIKPAAMEILMSFRPNLHSHVIIWNIFWSLKPRLHGFDEHILQHVFH